MAFFGVAGVDELSGRQASGVRGRVVICGLLMMLCLEALVRDLVGGGVVRSGRE